MVEAVHLALLQLFPTAPSSPFRPRPPKNFDRSDHSDGRDCRCGEEDRAGDDRETGQSQQIRWFVQPIHLAAREDCLQNGFLSGWNWLFRELLREHSQT